MKEEIVQGIVPFLSCSYKDKENLFFAGMRGQFHQPIGTKHKFASTWNLAQKMPFCFTIKTLPVNLTRSYAQLLRYAPERSG